VVRRCTILHQAVAADAPPDEQDVLAAADAVARGLLAAGWSVARLAITADLTAAAAALRDEPPDLVFNLVESLDGADVLAPAVPALLERLGLAFTGAGLAALALTADKRATRRALGVAGIAVPPGPEDGWPGPFIVKRATAHASADIGTHSVRAAAPPPMSGWYAEAYVDGREFAVSLLDDGAGGVRVLPVAEMLFRDWPAGMPRILDYAAKWDPAHPAYDRTIRSFAVAPDLASRLAGLARACWDTLGLAGYARVDLRLASDGVAYVIDVNANPCLSEDAGFTAAAAEGGLDYASVVARIAEAPFARGPVPIPRGEARPALSAALRHTLRPDDDIAALCRSTGFFADAEIVVAEELAADARARGAASDYRFLLADDPLGLVGYACYGATAGTVEAWDLYWIVVHPRAQGSGLGRHLVTAVLDEMAREGGRRLYAETASKPLYAPTRAFYAATGFTLQAVVPDFFAPGDGKQIWLRVAAPRP
jgi:D-alanine-D-alanine ligase